LPSWERDVRCVLNSIVQGRVVRFLSIARELIDVLVNLKCGSCDTAAVLELYVELAWLLSKRLHLNGVAAFLKDACGIRWQLLLLARLLGVHSALLPRVDIHIKVLASCGVIVPA